MTGSIDKGDANDTLDRGYAESEDIIGIVRAKLR